MPTTGGCPAFARIANRTAPLVTALEAAGAILIGKQNMDHFATGLVGTRSLTGYCRNAFDARYIPGGGGEFRFRGRCRDRASIAFDQLRHWRVGARTRRVE
uniref:amidase family protein n=1 Tax=Paraburkholderia fungorum TaxID=134537 RepID=UPI0038B82B4C